MWLRMPSKVAMSQMICPPFVTAANGTTSLRHSTYKAGLLPARGDLHSNNILQHHV